MTVIFLGFHYHDANMELLATSGPGANGVGVYGTAFERSNADIEQIKEQVQQMLLQRPGGLHRFIEDRKCKGLSANIKPSG